MMKPLLLRSGLVALVALSCANRVDVPNGVGGGGQAGGSGHAPDSGAAGALGIGGVAPSAGGGVQAGGTSSSAGTGELGGGGAGVGGAGSAGAGTGGTETAPCPFGSSEYLLWSGTAPGSAGVNVVEQFTERSMDPAVQDRQVSGVTKPSLFAYLAKNPTGAAAIVLPGGGYTHLAFDKEGVDIAEWLNSLGVSAFVVKYRLPTNFPGSPWIALADAQRALRTVRHFASSCSIEPERIGVVGFSAGGHLASQLETRFSAQTNPSNDAIDAVDARPAFGVLIYPVISMDSAITHAGSKKALLGENPSPADVTLYSSERQVTSSTPATFIGVSNQDTAVKPENSIRFDDALKAAGIAHELHVYRDGGHGTGIRNATGDMADWPKQCATWLSAQP